jgi:hypothetical protein
MLLNKQTTKYYCDHCGDPIAESLIMVDGFYKYNSLSCANCTDYDEYVAEGNQSGYATEESEDDYDQPYDD